MQDTVGGVDSFHV